MKKTYTEFLFEAKHPSAHYRYETVAGKVVDAASDKVKKVVAVLKDEALISSAKRLVESYRKVESKLDTLKSQLEEIKNEVRGPLLDSFFDSTEATLTRVIEAADATITISKASVVDDKPVVAYEEFVKEMIQLNPMLESAITDLLKKHTTIKKGYSVASTVKVQQGVQKNVTESISLSSIMRSLRDFVKSHFGVFDKKLEAIKRKYIKSNITESCEECNLTQALIDHNDFGPKLRSAINIALQYNLAVHKVISAKQYRIEINNISGTHSLRLLKSGKRIFSCKIGKFGVTSHFMCNDKMMKESYNYFSDFITDLIHFIIKK